jgi:hypothetical protein
MGGQGYRSPATAAEAVLVDRAPAVESVARGAYASRWLGPGTPAAPVSARLALLPPGPDAIHRVTLRGT